MKPDGALPYRAGLTAVTLLAIMTGSTAAWAQEVGTGGDLAEQVAAVQSNLDFVWTMIAAALVLLMQVGFLLLEAGFVRSKNSINVAQKNVIDLVVSVAVFWLIGFTLMFGPSVSGFFGFGKEYFALDARPDWDYTFFVFQAVFCGTSATIMSGAVAERFTFNSYVLVTICIAALVYPVYGHWAWGNLLIGDNTAYLADKGFVDFAGSTVVHSVGAWVGLAIIIAIGPRLGRFDDHGKPIDIQGHSPVLSAAGALLLFVGWIGFNGGSTTAGTPAFSHIVANTVVAAVFGGFAALVYGWVIDGNPKPDRSINGLLGGLVAITAGCDVLHLQSAALVGGLGGIVALAGSDLLLRYGKVDDVVGAVGVHGFAGAFGTIILAFLAPTDLLPAGNRLDQFLVQSEGVAIAFAWSFGVTFAFVKAISLFMPIRVSKQHEFEGLNKAEHGATLGTGNLQILLADLIRAEADFSHRMEVDPGDEAAELSTMFNDLLSKLEKNAKGREVEENARRDDIKQQQAREIGIMDDIAKVIRSAADGDLSKKVPLEGKIGILKAASEGVNHLLETMDGVSQELRMALGGLSQGDLTRRLSDDRGGAFSAISDAYNKTADMLSGTIHGMHGSATSLDSISHQLQDSAERMRTVARDQEQRSGDAFRMADDTTKSIRRSHVSAEEAVSLSRESHAMSVESQKHVSETVSSLERATNAAKRALNIVEVIEEISMQTNLLSVNASVEASNAHEHGKGFVIIAQEVRRLSERVKQSSREISQILEQNFSLLGDVADSVEKMRKSFSRIESGADQTSRAVIIMGESLAQDVERMEAIYAAMMDIAKISKQAAGVADTTMEISTSIGASSRELRELTERFRRDPG